MYVIVAVPVQNYYANQWSSQGAQDAILSVGRYIPDGPLFRPIVRGT